MEAIEERLEYHELLMTLENLENIKTYVLPEDYSYSFWSDDKDLDDWVDIHINSGEFTHKKEARGIFEDFYSPCRKDITKRCFFIVDNNTNKKVATATISPSNDGGVSLRYRLACNR